MPIWEPELVQIEDSGGNPLRVVSRSEAELQNAITPNVIIFVLATNNRVFLQRRSLAKAHMPGLWDVTACGGVIAGELPADAAIRELREEVGMDCRLTAAAVFLNAFALMGRGVCVRCVRRSHVFVGETAALPVPGADVCEVEAVTLHEIDRRLATQPSAFVPPFASELERARPGLTRLLRSA
jgi:isopentenyldiphosphate isomerase